MFLRFSRLLITRPTAAWVFPLRNFGRSGPLALAIMLAVLLIAGIVSIIDSIPFSVYQVYGYSRYLTGVTPRGDMSLIPKLQELFKNSPVHIEKEMVARTVVFNVNSIVGPWPFILHGVRYDEAEYLAKKVGLGRLRGRLPETGAAEAVISAPLARNLGLELGDILLGPNDEQSYSPKEVIVVGIYEGEEWLAMTSYDYIAKHHFPPVDVLMLTCQNQEDQRKLDAWTESALKGQRAMAYTYPSLVRDTEKNFTTLFQILNLAIGLLVVVITLMMGMLINIYLAQRTTEFGLLHALGFTRGSLIKRSYLEALLVVLFGWVAGVFLSYLFLLVIKHFVMDPRGYYIDPLGMKAYLYTLVVPISILVGGWFTVWNRFRSFDPIHVIERRIA
jgi:hypothetical protein